MFKKKLIVASLSVVLVSVGAATAQEAEAPRVTSWSNSKTADAKTVFQVKPGEKITFSIEAEGAEKYVWLVDRAVQEGADTASFKWTIPNKKGMWKIIAKTTNKARRQWAKERAVVWDKWIDITGTRPRYTERALKEKKVFIQEMIEHRVHPVKAQKEWMICTFLKKVNPAESIQKAIDSLPPEGGIIELAEGVHDVKEPIIINRGNVIVYGTHKSEIRAHDPTRDVFSIPDECRDPPNRGEFAKRDWKNKPVLENFLFKGFKFTSTYKKSKGVALIEAWNVKNFTVEDILDLAHAYRAVSINPSSSGTRAKAENIMIRRNVFHHSKVAIYYSKPISVLDNTFKGPHAIIHIDRNNRRMHVIGNHVDSTGGRYACMIMDVGPYYDVCDNVFIGNYYGIRLAAGPDYCIVSNNTVTGGTRGGIQIDEQGRTLATFVNNRIYDSKGHGILAMEHHWSKGRNKYGDVKMINNVIYGHAGDGVEVRTGITLYMKNNIIARNGGYGINNSPTGKISFTHNNIWNNAKGGYEKVAGGEKDISADPLFANPSEGDFHLRSRAGRWDPKAKKWVKDKIDSPCIDAGDPKTDHSREPAPNGGRVNMGAYGNTEEASKSAVQ